MTTFPIVNRMQKTLLAISILCSILPTVAVSLRILSHRIAHRSLTASDWLAVVAAALAVAFQGVQITTVVRCGLGWGHNSEVEAAYGNEPIHKLLQLILAFELLWGLSLSCSKLSILLLYSRLFRDSYVVVASKITAVFTFLWAVSVVLAVVLICQPMREQWVHVEGGHCGNQFLLYLIHGFLNLATDLIVVLLPLPHLYRLKLPMQTKICLGIVFSLGLFTCIISIARLSYIEDLNFADVTFTLPLPSLFTGLEPSMAATLCSVPLLKPLLWIGKRQRPSRVRVAGNTVRSHQFDPDHAGKLKLRPDNVAHRAVVSANEGGSEGMMMMMGALPRPSGTGESSFTDLKSGDGPEITVNKQWKVTSEVGDWTQILGSR